MNCDAVAASRASRRAFVDYRSLNDIPVRGPQAPTRRTAGQDLLTLGEFVEGLPAMDTSAAFSQVPLPFSFAVTPRQATADLPHEGARLLADGQIKPEILRLIAGAEETMKAQGLSPLPTTDIPHTIHPRAERRTGKGNG